VTTGTSPQAPDDEHRGGFVALMRHRNYALLWSGQLVSHLGDRFHWVAISLWVYAQTGSALSVSYAIVALMVAPAIVGLFAGAMADRYDRRRIMIVADLVRAGLVALIPALMARGLPWVYGTLFLMSAASAFFRPAMWSAVPQSVPRDRLLQANAYFASLEAAVEVLGPAMAGLLVMRFSYAAAMYVDAVSYLVSAVFVAGMKFPPPGVHSADSPMVASKGILSSIREGVRYVRRDQIQVSLLAFLFLGQWVAGLSSLQTPLAKGILGITDRQFGWFQSVWGVGFIAASVAINRYGRRIPRGQAIVIGYLLWAMAAGLMGLSSNFGMLIVAGFWVGFANILVFVNVSTVMMEHTPIDKLGRAVTVRQIGVAIVRVVSLTGFGWLADTIGIRQAIAAMASTALFGSSLAAVRFPALWRYLTPGRQVVPSLVPLEAQPVLEAHIKEPPLAWLVTRVAGASLDPEFAESEQRWLNTATLAIVGLGWLAFLVSLPGPALGTAAVVIATSTLPGFARARWRWQRLLREDRGRGRGTLG
jgi:MFS family permease